MSGAVTGFGGDPVVGGGVPSGDEFVFGRPPIGSSADSTGMFHVGVSSVTPAGRSVNGFEPVVSTSAASLSPYDALQRTAQQHQSGGHSTTLLKSRCLP